MNKTKLDWRIAEDESAWQRELEEKEWAAARDIVANKRKIRWTRRQLWIVVSACAMILATATFAAYRLHRRSEEQLAAFQRQLQDELQSVVDAESSAWLSDDPSLAATFLDTKAPVAWQELSLIQLAYLRHEAGVAAQTPVVHVDEVELQGDVALVTTTVEQSGLPWLPHPFRERRFYRDTYGQWLRTLPDPGYWGQPTEVATDHFRFSFTPGDADSVKGVAAHIESIYAEMRHEVGMPAPTSSELVAIDLATTPDRDYELLYRTISAEVADGLPLSTANVSLSKLQSTCSWQSSQSYEQNQSSPCPDSLEIHFTTQRLQLPSPLLMALPGGISASDTLSLTLAHRLAGRVLDEALHGQKLKTTWLHLIQGIRLWLGCHGDPQPLSWLYLMDELVYERAAHDHAPAMMHGASTLTYHADLRILEAATLIEYATQRFDPQRLPALIAALSRYDSWQTLIPAVYGLSSEQFEQGWREYLKQRPDLLVSIP